MGDTMSISCKFNLLLVLFLFIILSCGNFAEDASFLMSYKFFGEENYQRSAQELDRIKPDYKYKKEANIIKSLITDKKYSEAKLKFESIVKKDRYLNEVCEQEGLYGKWYLAGNYLNVGVKLYYGNKENKSLVGEIIGFEDNHVYPDGTTVDCVMVRMENGNSVECKEKIYVSDWYVKRNDPKLR